MHDLKKILEGRKHDIYALTEKGRCLLEEFMKALPVQEQKKLLALLKRIGNDGILRNEEKFRHLEGPVYELKSYQVRIPCFFDGEKVILTHGFVKKQDRTRRSEIDRALRVAKEYFLERKVT